MVLTLHMIVQIFIVVILNKTNNIISNEEQVYSAIYIYNQMNVRRNIEDGKPEVGAVIILNDFTE